MCSCADYVRYKKCVHHDVVFKDVRSRMRIIGLSKRGVTGVFPINANNCWQAIEVPRFGDEDVVLCQIYQRD